MIKQGDCLELMKEIPDGTVDAIICDLPYGTTECSFDIRIPFEPMWEQFLRVCKLNAAIVLFSQLPFGSDLIQSQRKLFRYEWVWEKSLAVGFLNAKRMPLRAHENILVFYRSLPTYNPQWRKGRPQKARQHNTHSKNYRPQVSTEYLQDGEHYHPRDVLYFNSTVGHEERLHPQQKPLDLLEYLIRTYTNEGETVLDATMGSGSTGVACLNSNRQFIGFELDEKNFSTAKKRIEKVERGVAQKLFA